jgi:hypothetical protein
MSDLIEKRYLGDSVYAEVEDGMVKVTTHNGYPDDPRNVIFIEPSVMDALVQFYEDAKEAAAAIRHAAELDTPEP